MLLALALATSSLEITFSLRSRVINKLWMKKRSTCGKSKGWWAGLRNFSFSEGGMDTVSGTTRFD